MSDPKHPLLALWRSAPCREVVARSDDLLALLAEVTRFKEPADQALLGTILALPRFAQGSRAWAIATKLAHRTPEESDLFMSWVAFAAVRHSGPAILLLLQVQASQSKQRLLRRAFVSWLRAARESLSDLSTSSGRTQLAGQLAAADLPALVPTAESDADDDIPSVDDAGPTLAVLDAGPDGGAFDDTVERCRAVLREPLPLLGSISPAELRRTLVAEFPWLQSAIDRIVDDLALARSLGRSWLKIQPLLIVGPPGAGKTRLARRLAEIAGIPLVVVGAGGSSDNRALQGTARGYSSSYPSSLLLAMADHRCANPLVLVDEVDKASPSRLNGSIQDTLLGMLERESASRWYDEALMAPADLSQVNWLLCANDLGALQRPLLSRVTVIRVGLPGREAFGAILSGILSDVAQQYRVDPRLLPPLEPETVAALRARFQRGASVRELQVAVLRALALRAKTLPDIIN